MGRFVLKLPDIGEGVVEGEVVAWHVRPGDMIREDQPLVDIMTDKATVTIPSPTAGRIISTRGNVGENIAVGSELVVLEAEKAPGEVTVSVASETGSQSSTAAPGTNAGRGTGAGEKRPGTAPPVGTPSPQRVPERPLASPAVRRRAREKGVDLGQVAGTGRGGRITDGDVDDFLEARAPTPDGHSRIKRSGTTEIHISGLRRSIARKMTVSNQHIPHFSYFEQVDITELAALRQHLNDHRLPDEPRLSYLPFIMLALVKAFRRHPEANAHYDDEREVVTRFEAVNLGIATQTERGLYVPVVKHVEAMDLREAARELRRVTQAVHHNTVKRDELTGSTFTITSLGVLGGLAATPIINHPEVAILGVHKAYDRPVVINGQVAVRHMVNLSSSFDHRVVDGADGATLIQTLKEMLEHPALIFL